MAGGSSRGSRRPARPTSRAGWTSADRRRRESGIGAKKSPPSRVIRWYVTGAPATTCGWSKRMPRIPGCRPRIEPPAALPVHRRRRRPWRTAEVICLERRRRDAPRKRRHARVEAGAVGRILGPVSPLVDPEACVNALCPVRTLCSRAPHACHVGRPPTKSPSRPARRRAVPRPARSSRHSACVVGPSRRSYTPTVARATSSRPSVRSSAPVAPPARRPTPARPPAAPTGRARRRRTAPATPGTH